jgi:formylglycine-generating enzyme required for sulfatase activity
LGREGFTDRATPGQRKSFSTNHLKCARPGGADRRRFPVEQVSWGDVQEFIRRLNERENRREWLYRLPTEMEWEYACRGGAGSKKDCSCHFYLDHPTNHLSSDQANFDGNYPCGKGRKGTYLERTCKVGSYKPNRFGIYDMHGNVWEWCDDWTGSERVVRGGSWYDDAELCRAAKRGHSGDTPSDRSNNLGLRLALVPASR